jgi:FAD/FMN-containing dehydrogenase
MAAPQPAVVGLTGDLCFTTDRLGLIIAVQPDASKRGANMAFAIHTRSDLERLRARLHGPVVGPDERGWDSARQAWNLAVEQRPAAVAYPTNAQDVIAILSFAREHGLRVAGQATGHGASTLELDDTVLIKTVRMAGVEIDAVRRVARVTAGATWGELAVRAGEHRLAGLAGSAADVGVVGYTLGGGVGWLARRHGLACNSVRAVELVTVSGEPVRADRDQHSELFWALRGGGGAFGIVTAIEFDLDPVDQVFAGTFVWPADRAAAVLERYAEWTATVPDTLSSIFRLLNAPPVPSIPEPIRGRSVVTLDAAYLGGADEGARLLEPLRACGGALLDSFQMVPASQLAKVHGEPDQPTPGIGEGMVIRALSAGTQQAFLNVGGPGSGSPLVALELRHLGGALAAPPAGHGALASLDGEFALYGVGSPAGVDHAQAIHAHLDAVNTAMRPHSAERSYPNFADRRGESSQAFSAADYTRLRQIKAAYDPDDLIRSNHPVAPLPAV